VRHRAFELPVDAAGAGVKGEVGHPQTASTREALGYNEAFIGHPARAHPSPTNRLDEQSCHAVEKFLRRIRLLRPAGLLRATRIPIRPAEGPCREMTGRRTGFIPRTILVITATPPGFQPVSAQEIQPRAYLPSPVRVGFAGIAYSYNAGGLLFHPSLPITDGNVSATLPTLSVGGTFATFDRTSQFLAVMPYAVANLTARSSVTLPGTGRRPSSESASRP